MAGERVHGTENIHLGICKEARKGNDKTVWPCHHTNAVAYMFVSDIGTKEHNATSCSYCCFGIIMACCIYHCSQNYNAQQNANSFWNQATSGKKSTTWALPSRSFFCKNSYIWSIAWIKKHVPNLAMWHTTFSGFSMEISHLFPWIL